MSSRNVTKTTTNNNNTNTTTKPNTPYHPQQYWKKNKEKFTTNHYNLPYKTPNNKKKPSQNHDNNKNTAYLTKSDPFPNTTNFWLFLNLSKYPDLCHVTLNSTVLNTSQCNTASSLRWADTFWGIVMDGGGSGKKNYQVYQLYQVNQSYQVNHVYQ